MLKRLFSELRRRRVPQVAGFYLAAGWVIFEVAEGTFPRLGLPDWTITFVLVLLLLAFPLVIGLAWFYDIGPGGVQRTPDAVDAEGAQAPDIRPPAQWVGRDPSADALDAVAASADKGAFGKIAVTGAILILALAGGAFVLLGGDEPEVDVVPEAMVVLPFTVRGGDDVAVLADGMVELLSAKLDGVGDLRSADPNAVLSLVDGDVDAAGARDLARRLGGGHYVLGSVLGFGSDLRLQATIYETGSGRAVAEADVEGEAAAFLDLVDDLAAELLVAGDFAPPGRMPRIAAMTTEDLDALRFFLQGERALRERRYDDAIPLFERAVEQDTAFALAYYRMAVAASWDERSALMLRAIRSAGEYQDRLGERDRQLVEAYAAQKFGRYAEAEERYRRIVASYPDDLEGWYELGETLLHNGPFLGHPPEAARRAFERALELDPAHGSALYHLSNIAAWERNMPLLDSTTQAMRAQGDGYAGLGIEAQYAFSVGDSAAMSRILERIAGEETGFAPVFAAWAAGAGAEIRRIHDAMQRRYAPDPPPTWRIDVVANELAGRGVRGEALSWLEDAEEKTDLGAPVRTALLALYPYLRVDLGEVARLRDAVMAWDPGPVQTDSLTVDQYSDHSAFLPHLRLYILGLAENRLGRSGEALRLAQELTRLDGTPEVRTLAADLALHIRAQVAMDQGLMAEALRIIEQSSFWESQPWDERFSAVLYRSAPITLRADALQALGRYREAIRWHSVVELSPDRGYSAYRRAQAYEALDEPARAAEEYAEFLRLWEDADPDLQDRVEDARRRLAALTGER